MSGLTFEPGWRKYQKRKRFNVSEAPCVVKKKV
jgi:hypothetical protein